MLAHQGQQRQRDKGNNTIPMAQTRQLNRGNNAGEVMVTMPMQHEGK
jgi:hypothetical protein